MATKHLNNSLGFSLVELSIVLVILGLLTGGILAGQNLIRAAELRSLTTEVNQYTTAMYTFRDRYLALPGDMPNATDFWPTECIDQNSENTCNGDGDGMIENRNNFGMNKSRESNRFWQHLILAGLIEGTPTDNDDNCESANACIPPAAGTWQALPKGKLGQSYLIHGDGSRLLLGTIVPGATGAVYTAVPGISINQYGTTTTGYYLTPEEMWNIDTKIDDGKPLTGQVVPASSLSNCITLYGNYFLTSADKICAFYMNLRGSFY